VQIDFIKGDTMADQQQGTTTSEKTTTAPSVVNEEEARKQAIGELVAQMGNDLHDEGLQNASPWKNRYKPVITDEYIAEKVKAENKASKTSSFFEER